MLTPLNSSAIAGTPAPMRSRPVLDMLSNGVAILAVSVAARGPDDDHPYGHEKFETLGTLAIVCLLSITCFELLRQSVGDLTGARPFRAHRWPMACCWSHRSR